ncbi:MAG TPA: tRNA (adenosine(37)-N6)-dimethylallyltransferase MiaA [Candidatus Omnitrophota bacterium]|nr:tRNA (adenosine(37)-N6)-dimethylallyltransferase MiaA [Candidatus Omnitrophota bacterium]HSA31546.1 tRNA (adenosine(37)-N6)-dimethylallyltransferase MiaA [Candidatus Omnitrophota bacterium]
MPHPFSKQTVVCIVGPTAVGKTAVSVELAKSCRGEIVSCDSMQVYQEVSIASNKPSPEELTVSHHLLDCVSLADEFDAVQYQRAAAAVVENIFFRGNLPVVTGGSGLYLKALIDGIFEGVETDRVIREGLLSEAEESGVDALYQRLQNVDPEAASRIHPHDLRRIIRALEVYQASGRPISDWQKSAQGIGKKYHVLMFGLTMDRERLYERIDQRVEKMIEQGLLDEVRRLKGLRLSKTAQAIIGVREMLAYLNGECSLKDAKEAMKQNTRRLAKRQMTWFRAEKRLKWIDLEKHDTIQDVVESILQQIDESRPYVP